MTTTTARDDDGDNSNDDNDDDNSNDDNDDDNSNDDNDDDNSNDDNDGDANDDDDNNDYEVDKYKSIIYCKNSRTLYFWLTDIQYHALSHYLLFLIEPIFCS